MTERGVHTTASWNHKEVATHPTIQDHHLRQVQHGTPNGRNDEGQEQRTHGGAVHELVVFILQDHHRSILVELEEASISVQPRTKPCPAAAVVVVVATTMVLVSTIPPPIPPISTTLDPTGPHFVDVQTLLIERESE